MPVEPLSAVRRRLNKLHKVDGLSWRKIAAMDEFRGVSHATLRDIANGANPSLETCRTLGIRKSKTYTVAFHVADRGVAEELRKVFARHGKRRDVARKLVRGDLKLVEND